MVGRNRKTRWHQSHRLNQPHDNHDSKKPRQRAHSVVYYGMSRFSHAIRSALFLLSGLATIGFLQAQVVTPPSRNSEPQKPGARPGPRGLDIGPGNVGGGLGLAPTREETTVRTISYIVLGPDREWTNTDGQVITAKVIAWQDSVEQTVTPGKPTAEQTNPTANPDDIPHHFIPVVIKNDQVRILRNRQAFALPLNRLSEDDQAYVRQLDEAVRANAARRAAAEKAARESPRPDASE